MCQATLMRECCPPVEWNKHVNNRAQAREEPEEALIDCTHQAAVPLNPGQTVFGSCFEGAMIPHFHFQAALGKLNLVHAQQDLGLGE
jgi:hypothetical protein